MMLWMGVEEQEQQLQQADQRLLLWIKGLTTHVDNTCFVITHTHIPLPYRYWAVHYFVLLVVARVAAHPTPCMRLAPP